LVRLRRFSRRERALLAQPTWFKSIRMLDKRPGLATEDFAARLKEASEECDDRVRASVLEQTSHLISQVVTVGLGAAAKDKIGASGMLAGEARELRSQYYKTGKAADLCAALDTFVCALLEDDDPMLLGQGGPLQGFAATLMDFSELVESPLVHHLGCLAFLGCITANLAIPQPFVHDSWLNALRRAVIGVKLHLDRLGDATVDEQTAAFYASVRRAMDSIERTLEASPEETEEVLDACFPAMCLALACTRVELTAPSGADREIDAPLSLWLGVVHNWIERYGSDFLRLSIANVAAIEDAFQRELERSLEQNGDGTSIAHAPLENTPFLTYGSELKAGVQAFLDDSSQNGEEEVETLLALAVIAAPVDEQGAQELAARARHELDRRGPAEPSDPDATSLLSSASISDALCSAVEAHVDPGLSRLGRFHGVRSALPIDLVERIYSVLEPALATLPDDAAELSPETRRKIQVAVILANLAPVLTAGAIDIGLPEGERYRAARDALGNAFFGQDALRGELIVHPDAPRQAEIKESLARFLSDTGELADREDERDRLCDWLATAYEAGHLSFPFMENEITAISNLGWLHYRAGRFDEAVKWLGRGRRLALEYRALSDVAIADLNLAGCFSSLMQATSWTTDDEDAHAHVALLVLGLSYVAEAFRIISTGWELSEPEDRYFLNSVGFAGVRELAQDLLHRAGDGALLAEYLLNARGTWFLLDLYDSPTEIAGGEKAGSTIVTWRKRSWVAQSLTVDEILDESQGESTFIDLAEILAPNGHPEAAWFGNLFDADSGALSSAFLVPPMQFASRHSERLELPEPSGAAICEETAALLGDQLPEALWAAADLLCDAGKRTVLFVSVDAGLPPISMGLWSRLSDGAARVVADAFDVVYCPSPAPRPGTTPWHATQAAARPQVFAVCDPLGDLPQARIAPKRTAEILGNCRGSPGPPANRETVLAAIDRCALADGVFVYQGHSEPGSLDDPEAASLLLEPVAAAPEAAERLSMGMLLRGLRGSSSGRMPRRAAFLSCGSGLTSSKHDATGIAMAALAGGADSVISTLRLVSETAPWEAISGDLIDTLTAPDPWRCFGEWQQRIALELSALEHEDARRTVAGIAMFGTPYVRTGNTIEVSDE
jgi:tetratricopeptide (TPR) repeat protein